MKKPRITIVAAITLLALLFTLFSFAAFSKAEFSHNAQAAALYEPTCGEFIYEYNADTPLPMASTTKIMTALVALRECKNLDEHIEIDNKAVGIEGSSAYFQGGEIYSLYDLLHIMMLRSANDAAVQIAITVSGDVESFVALMNDTAREFGLKNTSFENPSGLDADNHYTTARDLAIITAQAMKYEAFCEAVSKRVYTATDLKSGNKCIYVNHNKLLCRFDGCTGVKTGYTKRSGRSLVSSAERDGVSLIAVTINDPDDWNDHENLLELGFSALEFQSVISKDFKKEIPIVGSKQESIFVTAAEDFGFVCRKCAKTELIYDLPSYLIAPIKRGDKVGTITVKSNGVIVKKIDIVADTDAEKTKSFFKK